MTAAPPRARPRASTSKEPEMAYDKSGTEREVKSLLSRYPKPDRAKEAALSEMRDKRMLEKMGEEYDKIMPRLAKGGTASSRADGCATKGKTKGRFV